MKNVVKFLLLISTFASPLGCHRSSGDEENISDTNATVDRGSDGLDPQSIGQLPATAALPPVALTKYPVVLHHGFMGGGPRGKFVGAKAYLEGLGYKVFETLVSPVQTSEQRGKEFAAQVEAILASSGSAKVNIIAHSQGGLDARYAVSSLGLGERVASLSTLSTPHHGTPVADAALSRPGPIGQRILIRLINAMGDGRSGTSNSDAMAAAKSLTTDYVDHFFNPANPDVANVLYQSWGAETGRGSGDITNPLLGLPNVLLNLEAGPNDGVVPVSSAKWGTFRGVLQADHMDLIGVRVVNGPRTFDHLKFLRALLTGLAGKGL